MMSRNSGYLHIGSGAWPPLPVTAAQEFSPDTGYGGVERKNSALELTHQLFLDPSFVFSRTSGFAHPANASYQLADGNRREKKILSDLII